MPITFPKRIPANVSATGLSDNQFVYVLNAVTKQLTSTSALTKVASGVLLSIANELQLRASNNRLYSSAAGTVNLEAAILLVLGLTGADIRFGAGSGDTVAVRPENLSAKSIVDLGSTTNAFRSLFLDGALQIQPGNAASTWALGGGLVYTDATDHATAGGVGMTGVDQDMASVSTPADLLATNNDTLVVISSGVTAATANSKTIKTKYGASTIATITGAFNNVSWVSVSTITRTGATSQRCDGITICNATPQATFATGGETLSGAVTLKTTGSSAAGSPVPASEVTTKKLQYFWFPGQ